MKKDLQKINIVICMGSSCFSRGNNKAIQFLQEYLRTNGLEDRVHLEGSLCENACAAGPNISINGTRYEEVAPSTCIDLLKYHLKQQEHRALQENDQ
jgi:NADH:ubiquinone oxidoreductase subunit E